MKRTLALILTLAMILSCGVTAFAAEPAVVASPQTVTVDGETVTVSVYNIDGYNYFRLRDMAIMLDGTDSQFDVAYDEATGAISVTTFSAYSDAKTLGSTEDLSKTCVASSQTLTVDGQSVTLAAYNIGGYNYFKLRDLGNELGFNVDFADNTAVVESVEALSWDKVTVTELKPHVDGKEVSVTKYEAVYCATPNRIIDQQLALFIPENATADSPIVYMVDNSGWQSDAYADVCSKVASYGMEVQTLPPYMGGGTQEVLVGDYYSGTDTDPIGECLANGYVILVAGLRSRNNGATDGEYLGHAATMTDAKAVIRWVKANADSLPAGNADRIVITGTSGGGALSVVIAASGNSSDYYEGLYEIGAAGIKKNRDGSYTDTLSDDIWGTIAYCPITDLPNACAAYEWTWAEARAQVLADDAAPAGGFMSPSYPSEELMAEATAVLTENYVEYLDSLGLESVSSANLEATIIALMEAEIQDTIDEIGLEALQAEIAEKELDWVAVADDGTITYDYEKHLYWVGTQTAFKAPSAFSNTGMTAWAGNMNEDNLFGDTCDAYSPFNEYSWNNDDTTNHVGKDDTGLTWSAWLAEEEGQELAAQMKRTSPIPYLLSDDGDSAANWYVRYGMADRDSSFAVEAVLNAAMEADETITNLSFEFAWLKPHSGDYDVQEAYAWLKEALEAEAREDVAGELDFADATMTTLTPHLDGVEIKVDMYEDVYCAVPNRAEDQRIAIYVPENATAESPIIFMVNNSGWQSNAYSGRNGVASYGWVEETKRGETKLVLKGDYVSDSDSDAVGRALSEGYVIVSCGARSRNNGATGDEYLGHSPATMTDTKAAFRYLRLNADKLPAGDPEKIIVTGTSGGGALSVVLSASGDSEDYFESLYEIGAAGIVKNEDGTYTSTISDAVWGTIAYCPITDLGNACAAYEWTWGETRFEQIEDGTISYNVPTEAQKEASELLTANYVEYVDGLGLDVTSETLKEAIIALMKAEIQDTIDEIGLEALQAEIAEKELDWVAVADDGTITYDYEKHLYWVGTQSTFKAASAFSNTGMSDWKGERNEDNLFGSTADDYSPFNEYSWNNDDTKNAVGLDDTGLTWDEFLATEDGERLALQMKMTSPIEYLLDGTNSTENWYVRYGMADRDSSFAVETILYYSLLEAGIDPNFEFAWLKGHSGNYDVQEAYDWIKYDLLGVDPLSIEDAEVTELNVTLDGEAFSVTQYVGKYYTDPAVSDQIVTLYVPENATADSPIIYWVNNGGWFMNQADKAYKVKDGAALTSTSDTDVAGRAFSEGYIIMSAGSRNRNMAEIGHSPATMTDYKAAIRWLRYNAEALGVGDTDKIVATGLSGGGALSTVLAASGNSSDYFESLYEAGALGIVKNEDGTYTSTISDAIWGVIAYCPITDLENACEAYEWQYMSTREAMYESGHMDYGTVTEEMNMAASAQLKAEYEEYLTSLGIEAVAPENLEATIIALMEKEIAESIEEIGVEQMKADLAATEYAGTWLTINEDGTFEYDYEEHLYWLARKQTLKPASAFSNVGMSAWKGQMNEDNLFGEASDVYCPFGNYSWMNDDTANAVGYDDTNLTWEEFLATEKGEMVQLQMRMTSAVSYLLNEGDADVAPNWYVRHGMADRDTAFAVEALLYNAMLNNESVDQDVASFEFAWLQGHAGNYDVQEAYDWLAEALAE